MRVAVTGTPGTGKTSATERLDTELSVVHLNDVIRNEELTAGRDENRDSDIADLDAVADWLSDQDDVVFESHLAHQFDADRVVVCRCHPDELEDRLADRGESPESVAENAESEAMDLVLSEAVDRHGTDAVYEIVTTEKGPEAVAAEIDAVIEGRRDPQVGTVSYTEYL